MFGHSEQSENTAIRPATQGQNGARVRPVIQSLGILYFLKLMKIIGSRARGKLGLKMNVKGYHNRNNLRTRTKEFIIPVKGIQSRGRPN